MNPARHLQGLAGAALTFLLFTFRWGYAFGREECIEVQPYVLLLQDKTGYLHDFYLQNLSAQVPNVRWLCSWLLSLSGSYLFEVSFLLYVSSGLLLAWAIWQTARRFIQNDWLAWLPGLVGLIPLFDFTLGGNELFGRSFVASTAAEPLGVLALLLWLRGKWLWSALLLVVVTWLHATSGLQLFLLLSGSLFFAKLLKWNERSWGHWLAGTGMYFLLAVPFLILLQWQFKGESFGQDVFDIIYRFRLPHHYLPSTFAVKNWIIAGGLLLFGLVWYHRYSKLLFLFYCLAIFGLVIYTIGAEWLDNPTLTALQWFKTTIWLKMLGLIAVFAAIEKAFHWLRKPFFQKLFWTGNAALSILAVVLMLYMPHRIPWQVPYDFNGYINAPEVQIAMAAKTYTPEDALFIQPMLFTELKYFGERSSYLDYKAIVHRAGYLREWYKRVNEIYGVGLAQNSGFAIQQRADSAFYGLNENQLMKLRQTKGITHILTRSSHHLSFSKTAQNEEWVIYEIE